MHTIVKLLVIILCVHALNSSCERTTDFLFHGPNNFPQLLYNVKNCNLGTLELVFIHNVFFLWIWMGKIRSE